MEVNNEFDIAKFIKGVINNAIKNKVSYIHIEPYEEDIRIRFRIDGDLETVKKIPIKFRDSVISQIRIMSNFNLILGDQPQSCRFRINFENRKIDLTAEFMPSIFGKSIVIKIFDIPSNLRTLEDLGFEENQLNKFRKGINFPWGMVFITGPTGSGKSLTLSTVLKELNNEKIKIVTVEDPVEYTLKGINQVQVNPYVGLTFDAALKSLLKGDPDIIMVGEIRDYETVNIVVNASLTGLQVFTTLHTNEASSTIVRLINMGMEPFLIGASLNLIVSQRLVRKICSNCKVKDESITDDIKRQLGIPENKLTETIFYKGKGCPNCHNTGYQGRTAIFEVLPVDEEIRRGILRHLEISEIKALARKQGMHTFREMAVVKALKGITTVEEVFRTTMEDRKVEG